jgi:diguanylate cyclase (GGDEF)-like protein
MPFSMRMRTRPSTRVLRQRQQPEFTVRTTPIVTQYPTPSVTAKDTSGVGPAVSSSGRPGTAEDSEHWLDLVTRREQCEYVMSRQPMSILGSIISSALIVIVIAFSGSSSLKGPLIWFAVVLLNQVRRASVYFRYKHEGIQENNLATWEAHVYWGSLLSGCLFGVTPLVFWSADLTTQFAMTIVAFALILGSIQITISEARVSGLYALSVLFPFIVRNAMEGTHQSYLIAALELTATLYFLRAANTVCRTWKESLQNRLRNQLLVAQLEKQATQLHHEAIHDRLTGLPNRTVLFDRLTHVIVRAQRQEVRCAVLYFDLDRFKLVNDSFGHRVGDELLQRVAESVSAVIREGDTFCRLAGDEFAILAEDIGSSEGAVRIAESVQLAVHGIKNIGGHPINASASVGIAQYPDAIDNETAAAIVARADMAMYVSKNSGRGTHTLYRESFVKDYPNYHRDGDAASPAAI